MAMSYVYCKDSDDVCMDIVNDKNNQDDVLCNKSSPKTIH